MNQIELFGIWVKPVHNGLTGETQCVHQGMHYLKAEKLAAHLRSLFPVSDVEIRIKE